MLIRVPFSRTSRSAVLALLGKTRTYIHSDKFMNLSVLQLCPSHGESNKLSETQRTRDESVVWVESCVIICV